MAKNSESEFTFEISLSVLNHLGRNLYRSFITVLGEAISNAWDADAENVWIYIHRDMRSLIVKDDGDGMTAEDFQNKFLKIGYSKRINGSISKNRLRPYIGKKGIGKLALLSCAETISILTRVSDKTNYVGGVIDNSGLNKAIMDDITPNEYHLGEVDQALFKNYISEHKHGTIIYFENIHEGIRNKIEYLKRLVALYFRFSLIDKDFNIFVNDEQINLAHLDFLSQKTQFLWEINEIIDPYILSLKNIKHPKNNVECNLPIKGFIASVEKPSNLRIPSTEEKVGVDLFVNGRLREKDILKHVPTTRIVESYLYGQIHFDELDEDLIDRFTTSREGIIADDPKFKSLLDTLKEIINKHVLEDWDKWRIELGNEGDPDNLRISRKERVSRRLFNVVSDDYSLQEGTEQKKKVDGWVKSLEDDAQFNFSSYAECFVSENLIRRFIDEQKIQLSPEALNDIEEFQRKENESKNKANLSIDIRRSNSVLSYLSMNGLANLVDKVQDPLKTAGLSRDACEYKPLRDALAHTALLTDNAKRRLNSVYNNIKARILILLSER